MLPTRGTSFADDFGEDLDDFAASVVALAMCFGRRGWPEEGKVAHAVLQCMRHDGKHCERAIADRKLLI